MINNRPPRILIAGGGTGGHLFPGVSIAGKFKELIPETGILFVNTGRPLDRAILESAGFRLKTVSAGGIKGVGPIRKLLSLAATARGLIESMAVIRAFKPDLVVGMGSYSAAPVVVAARLLRVPIVLHEQNILPGVANRLLSALAKKIFISFDATRSFFKPEKTVFTGNPIREELLSLPNPVGEALFRRPPLEMGADGFTILVLGGSQGARSINTAVAEALPFLPARNYRFIHQTGIGDEERIRSAYRAMEVTATVKSFFQEMGEVYHKADLIIARSGATTVAEITALGKPALFIPFPHAADNHQELNVQHLAAMGACRVIKEDELTGKLLAEKLEAFSASPALLTEMAAIAGTEGQPDAAATIVHLCLELLGAEQNVGFSTGALQEIKNVTLN